MAPKCLAWSTVRMECPLVAEIGIVGRWVGPQRSPSYSTTQWQCGRGGGLCGYGVPRYTVGRMHMDVT